MAKSKRPVLDAKVEVVGGKELRAALKRMAGDLSDLKKVGLEAAQPVADEARVLVPKLSGALEASIKPMGQASGAVVKAGGVKTIYAGPIHFGWPAHSIEPQPFLYDALDHRIDEVMDIYQENVQKAIDKV